MKRTHRAARRLGAGLGGLAALIGAVGLAGLWLDAPALRAAFSGFAGMNPNAGLGLVAAGVALVLAALPAFQRPIFRWPRRALAVLVAALGVVALVQHFGRVDFGIARLLFDDLFAGVEVAPGRMSRATGVGFVLFGFAMLFTLRPPRWAFWTGFALTALGFWTSLVVCIGYMFGAQAAYDATWLSSVATPTAIGFLALFLGMMLAVPDRGWARIVLTDKTGGVVARRMLPLVAAVPLATIWLAHKGAGLGLYSDRMAEYVAAVALLVILTTVVLVACGRLNVLDAHRRVMQDGRQRAQAAAVRLHHLAETDGLTGVWNRRHFLVEAQARVDAARAAGTPLSLLMLDVDGFKGINDRHGHAGGDQALRLLAATLKESTRRDDCCARLGGEEFAVLLPGATPAIAQDIAERIRAQVARLALLDRSGKPFGFTVSIGLAALAEAHDGPETLLARADAALYRAKNEGRNCVVTAEARAAA